MPLFRVIIRQDMRAVYEIEADCIDDVEEEVREAGSDNLAKCRRNTLDRTVEVLEVEPIG
jgi:hypothetical protein